MTECTGVEKRTYQLVYLSVRRAKDRQTVFGQDVRDILAEARAFNAGVGITGALLFNGTHFAQVLEGDRDAVLGLMNRILRDPRHSHVILVEEAFVEDRIFPDWAMAFADDTDRLALPVPADFDPQRLDKLWSRNAIVNAMRYMLADGQDPGRRVPRG